MAQRTNYTFAKRQREIEKKRKKEEKRKRKLTARQDSHDELPAAVQNGPQPLG